MLLLAIALAFAWLFLQRVRRLMRQAHLRKIPGPTPASFISGNLGQLFHPSAEQFQIDISVKLERVIQIKGFLGDIQLLVSDTRAVQHILVKDQHDYDDALVFVQSNELVFGPGLMSTLGGQHRRQRKIVNPAFSTNHLRTLIPIFRDVARQFKIKLLANVTDGHSPGDTSELDILEWMTRLSLELVGQGGLGYSFGTLNDAQNEYTQSLKDVTPILSDLHIYREFLPWVVKIGSAQFRRYVAETIPWKTLHKLLRVTDAMYESSKRIVKEKQDLLLHGDNTVKQDVAEGKDLMSILLRANNNVSEGSRLSDEELIGQTTIIAFAAMDTVSSALCRILQNLALHPSAQDRLRSELKEAINANGDFDYDDLHALPYLDAICRETLRLFPPVPMFFRTTREDVVIPLAEPIHGTDGNLIHEVMIPNDTTVFINALGANRDSSVWGSDAHVWKPERWLEPLPSKTRIPGVYSNIMTFSDGPRSCIGFKFAELEMKVVLVELISSLRFEVSKPVVWRYGMVMSPALEGDPDSKPQLPLRVSAA
ncbi:cytochrome P450 [Dentipellis sp. KUC8613]|nr:cytochrome P450 [Dentipellis sp. KUC8613]